MDQESKHGFFTTSPLRRHDIWGSFSIVILNLLILWIVFGNMLFRLNHVSFASGGDGLKSYYASLWHIRHDTSYHHFEGMNYPYGEHLFLTDSQPLITNPIKWISDHLFDLSGYTIGIINFLMLISIVIGALFLYLILRKAGVSLVIALIAATTIAWLSPQLGRLGGHFTLSYVAFIPGALFFLLLFAEKPTLLRSSLIALWGFILSITHFYFFGIVAILLLLFWVRAFIAPGNCRLSPLKKTGHLLLQLVLPLLILTLYLHFTDSVTDRPSSPWGFLYFRAYPESVLLPLGLPYARGITALFKTDYINWEGYAYAGATSSILFLSTFFYLIYAGIRRKFSWVTNPYHHPFASFIFWAGLLALLYSFAIPFVFKLEWLVKYLGPIRQMRGIARFSWLFFYAMQLIVIILSFRWYQKKKNLTATALLVLVLLINGTEAGFKASDLREQIDHPNPLMAPQKFDLNRADYQAIVPLPYFHVGSENIWRDDLAMILPYVLQTSLHNRIPTTGVFLSRSSLSQMYTQIEPFLTENPLPEIFSRYDQRKMLLISSPTYAYNPLEQNLIDSSLTLFADDNCRISEISILSYTSLLSGSGKMNRDTAGFRTVGDKYFPDIRKHVNPLVLEMPPYAKSLTLLMNVKDIRKDLIPRTGVRIRIRNGNGDKILEKWNGLGESLTGITGDEGIHRMVYELPENGKWIQLVLMNSDIKKHPLELSNIRIRFQ